MLVPESYYQTPIQTVELPPSEPAQRDLFAEASTPPDLFSEVGSAEAVTETREPSAITEHIAGLATMPEAGDGIDALTFLQQSVVQARENLRNNQETAMRYDAALKQAMRRQSTISDVTLPEVPEDLRRSIRERLAADSAATFEKRMKTSLEREALDRIEDLAAAGDYTQAKIIMNRYTEGREDVMEAWKENNVKRLMLSQLGDKLRQEDNEEGWWAATYTGIISMLQPSAFSYLGNIDEGVNGFKERFWRFFSPGSDMQRQADFLMSMSADDLAEYLPQLEANIRANSRYLGVENPDKAVELIGMFENPISDQDAFDMNNLGNVESLLYVAPFTGVIPYRAGARALSLPFAMAASGARKEAASKVNAAFETLVKEGPVAAQKQHGMDEETILDNLMPSAINPVRSAPEDETMLGLSGEVNYNEQAVRDFVEAWKLVETERFTSPDELKAAAQAVADKIAARTNTPVLDFDVEQIKLADSTHINRVVATLGRPDGKGLYATPTEARGFIENMGFDVSEDGVIRLEVPTSRTVTAEEEGFITRAFHGTKRVFEKFSNEFLGETTKASSAKIAHFFSSPRGAYRSGIPIDLAAREAAEAEMREIENADDALAKAIEANEYQYGNQQEVPLEAQKFLELNSYGNYRLNKEGIRLAEERIKRKKELESIIKDNTEVDPQHAVNIAWSYSRMAKKPDDEYLPVKKAEKRQNEAYDAQYRREEELMEELKNKFLEEGVYVRNFDNLSVSSAERAFLEANPNGRIIEQYDHEFETRFQKFRKTDEEYQRLSKEVEEATEEYSKLYKEYSEKKKENPQKEKNKKIVQPLRDEQTKIHDELEKLYKKKDSLEWGDVNFDIDREELEALIRPLQLRKEQLAVEISKTRLNENFKNPNEIFELAKAAIKKEYYGGNIDENSYEFLRILSDRLEAIRGSMAFPGSWTKGDLASYLGIDEDEAQKIVGTIFDKQNEGAVVYPVKIKTENMKVVEGDRSKYADIVYRTELENAQAEGFDGVIFKDASDPGIIDPALPDPPDGTYDVIAVFDPENIRMALEPAKIVQDVSGGYAVKIAMDIPDTAFLTNPIKPPNQGFLDKVWKNISQTSDPDVFNKAVQADNKFNKIQKIIDKQLLSAFRGLSKNERLWLNQVLAKGQNVEKWFSREEFSVLVERAMGKPPSEKMVKAYEQYRFNNDVEHMLRSEGVYREKVIRGYESVRFNAFGDEFDVDAVVDVGLPTERIYNISDDIHYVGDNALTGTRMEEMTARGYTLIRTERPIKIKDGTEIRYFLTKKADFQARPLRREQLAYSPGGHRLYTDKYFVKQAAKGTQPDTGAKFLKNANTYATGATIKDVKDWAAVMNAAREAVKRGKDAQWLDAYVFKGKGGPVDKNMPYPSGEEFIKMAEDGKIDLNEEFEAVFDREQPSAYAKAGVDVSKFMDDDELKGLQGYYAQTGRMYYSAKGDALRSTRGGLAPTVDPFEAQSQALFNVARMSASFSDFKTSSIDRWVKTYEPYLNTRILPEDQARSPMAIFNGATPVRDMPIALRQQMEGQRESIKRILGFESEFDRSYRHWMRSTSEWIVGDSDNALRKKMAEGVFWLQDRNPVSFLRGLAFDMKLGIFNIGQFFIQTSTMASAMALSPKHGAFGLASAVPVWSYFLSKGSENVLDTLAKRGVHKLGGFATEEEFKNYVRYANRTGFFDLGDSHVMVNDMGPAPTFGSLHGGVHAAREMGRWFFYNAEVMNRLVAHRIAYGEAVEKFGGAFFDNFLFTEFLAGRAENYSFNMSNASKAWWQQGLLSIPTQFWAYNVRMIEALIGKNFTGAQKARLAAMQLMIAGTGGIPLVAGLSEMVQMKYGVEPDIESMLGTMDRGLADRLIFELTDADVRVGEKWGTGSWSSDLVKDIFGYSEYNEKSFAEMVGGATGSIAVSTLGPVFNLAQYWMTAESGAEEVNLSEDEWLRLFKQVSTVNNVIKAYMVYNYGMYQSTKGTVLATDIPSQDAVAVALGFRPQELDVSSTYKAYLDNRSDVISSAASQIKQWRQEAMTRPDLLEENRKKVNAFVNLLPQDIKRDVLKRAHRSVDDSFYTGIIKRMEDVRRKEEIAKGFEQ